MEPAPAEASAQERHVVMVTGASGLVGRALRSVVEAEQRESRDAVKQDASAGAEWVWLRSADGDLCSADAVAALFDKHRPTHVVHLAAHVGGLFANMVCACSARDARGG